MLRFLLIAKTAGIGITRPKRQRELKQLNGQTRAGFFGDCKRSTIIEDRDHASAYASA